MANKKIGIKSSAQDNFLEPKAVTGFTATGVNGGAFNSGSANLAWTLPSDSPAATLYTIVSSPATTTQTTANPSSYTFTGIAGGTNYTFTITPSNAVGNGPSTQATLTPLSATVPDKVTGVSATSTSAGTDNLTWNIPANGGSAIGSYSWSSSDGKTGTSATNSASVSQEQGTAQTYTVIANNGVGGSAPSDASASVTTFFSPPSFFSPPGFFAPPGFFGPPGFFAPPGFFSPPGFGGCIEENTLIKTTTGMKAIKDLAVGDTIVSVDLAGIPLVGSQEESEFDLALWNSDSLVSSGNVEATVTSKIGKIVPQVMYFNGNESKKVSLVQHVFIKREGMYQVQVSADIVEGDYLVHVNEDGSLTDELIESITMVDGVATVYRLNTEPQDWFVADGILLHNLKI